MPTVFICDDESRMLSDIAEKVSSELNGAEISTFSNGVGLIEKLSEAKCDILLLDIDMPELNGLEIAARLGSLSEKPLLIFVTSHDELVYDSLQFHPFGFVRKGHLEKELPKLLADCMQEINSREKHFCFHANNSEIKLPLDDILYFEAEGNYLKLFAKNGEYRFRETIITAVENGLCESGFVRVHKGFLLNQSAVKILSSDKAELIDGTMLPIGRSYGENAKKRLMRYMLK
ncbi:MAG: response regulator transcription factor [Ruminococcaceae bacterium]|nr:response regulator transcription factor [Oscillospiraceae bacterium]